MIIRILDDSIVKVIRHIPSEQEDAFITKNPTGGFQKYNGTIPSSMYENYKMVSNEVVVDDIKEAALQATWDSQAYARSRASEYPAIVDQLDDIFHNGIDGWKATIQVTKDKYPKE